MTKHVQCPHCGQAYALTLEQVARLGGQTITCAQCNSSFLVSKDLAVTGGLATEPTTFDTRPEATAGATMAVPSAVPSMVPGISYVSPTVAAALGATQHRFPPRIVPRAPQQRRPKLPAIFCLIFGLLAIVIPVVPAVIAIVLGLVALRRLRDEDDRGTGMAMAGITIGVMGTLINGGVLLTYVLPALKQRRETAQYTRCTDNLKKISAGLRAYAADHDGRFPDHLATLLKTKQFTADALVCPASGDTVSPGTTPQEKLAHLSQGPHVSYTYAGEGFSTRSPPECVLLYEELDRHEPGMWVIFVDGRVEFIGEVEAAKASRRLRLGQNPPWTITSK